MDSTNLINFDEVCEPKLSVPTYYMMEQELFETKRKLSLLEERMSKLEENLGNLELEEKFDKIELEERMSKLEEQKSQSFSVIPFKSDSPFNNRKDWVFCDINCSSIKIDLLYIYFNDCKLFDIKDFIQNQYCFLKQFQNIKLIEIDTSTINVGESITSTENCGSMYRYNEGSFYKYYNSISFTNYILLIATLLSVYKNIDLIFKAPNLYPQGLSNHYSIFQEFMKSTNYKKLHIEIKNNLVINPQTGGASYVSQPYVNETKEHCLRNNIEFTSNIGL